MLLNNHNIDLPINREEGRIPVIYKSDVTSAQNKLHGPLLRLGMAFISLDSLDLFGYLRIYTNSSGTEG